MSRLKVGAGLDVIVMCSLMPVFLNHLAPPVAGTPIVVQGKEDHAHQSMAGSRDKQPLGKGRECWQQLQAGQSAGAGDDAACCCTAPAQLSLLATSTTKQSNPI
jgi:hypothetical protein